MSRSGEKHGRVRVVVVDDDEDIRTLIEVMIDHDSRFRMVGAAQDGVEAVSLVARLQPDAVILNVRLPGLDGIDALPLLRRRAPKAKMVAYSAFPDPWTLASVLQAGADSYLDVRATWSELLPTLEALLEFQQA
jgi:DNA-binding NarL/FixJ family response regulator